MPKFISTPLIGLTYTLIVAAWQENSRMWTPIPVPIKAYPAARAFARDPMVTTHVDNVANVEDDLKNKQPSFEAMLKSMLVWTRITTNTPLDEEVDQLVSKAETDYDNLLQAAVDFCNLAERTPPGSQSGKTKNTPNNPSDYSKLIKEYLYD